VSRIRYVELHCQSNFSFLEGASHPHELVQRAAELGYAGLALTDRHSLAGIIRGWTAATDARLAYYVGARVHLRHGPTLVLWPSDRAAYGRLCRLLTLGYSRGGKGEAALEWEDVADLSQGLLAGLILPAHDQELWLSRFRELFADRGYLLAHLHRGPDDRRRLEWLGQLSATHRVPLLAAGHVQYHEPQRQVLHDILAAIAEGTTVDRLAGQRLPHAQFCLHPLEQIERRYAACPEAIARTLEVASRIGFRLEQLRYEYPQAAAPEGLTPLEYLKRLTWRGAQQRYPEGVPERIISALRHELTIIEQLGYEAYFLTVWDLVRFARQRGILCQGRGSAANSSVCYCLGITAVDPNQLDLLFERFISPERNEAPDIDVDFEHQRREEVIQYIYDKYGRERAGMTAAVIRYRQRSAIREVGKALGLSTDRLGSLSKLIEGGWGTDQLLERCRQVGLEPESAIGQRFVYAVRQLVGFPRHLSQHVGGMVMTRGYLCELSPIEPASMPGRTVIQWDKDDLDALGILKVDCLALGMLTAIRRSLQLIEQHHGRRFDLATIPKEDPRVYDMICRAETIGVFQIESRAQMNMLPRLKPRCYYDLVIEVAIVRPGPIQGQMVHPYLKARQTGIQPAYPSPDIAAVLAKTLGVPIFQEQAMRLAVVAAGFTPGEADQLRRAMAAWRRPGVIDQFHRRLIGGMLAKGLSETFAEHVFTQIRGFGEYGFPESHAASFALLVYVSAWLKRFYPAAFCAGLLNSQPMGFYAPAQLVQEARRQGVVVRGVDVNHSQWESSLEPLEGEQMALRLGLHMILGLSQAEALRLVEQRQRNGTYLDTHDLVRRTRLGQAGLGRLADAGALASLAGDRRAAYWQALAQERTSKPLPLLEFSGVDQDEPVPEQLEPMSRWEEVQADYQTTGLSLRSHPLSFHRFDLHKQGVVTAQQLETLAHGRWVQVAGLVLIRQRPSTAKGITFVTIEDETGWVNLIVHPRIWQRDQRVCRTSNAWLVSGRWQRAPDQPAQTAHLVVANVSPLALESADFHPKARDFH
jgi:error-prone DNA polymerase